MSKKDPFIPDSTKRFFWDMFIHALLYIACAAGFWGLLFLLNFLFFRPGGN